MNMSDQRLINNGDIILDGTLPRYQKEKQAFEIIKKKRVEILKLDYYGWQLDLYNEDLRDEYRLTQGEYDLLKEVLLWVKV